MGPYAAVVDLPLFDAWPALARRLPRQPFVKVPTPVEPFPLEGIPEGVLWVKRDERSCPAYGGNKPRKLEFVIGHALERGARRLVTSGGLGTNHGLATAILGREAGLPTTCILVDQPVTDEVREKLCLLAAWEAELVYGRNVPGAALQGLRVLARSTVRGERPYLVATGGSSPRGTMGFVSAGFEIAAQVAAGELPEPERIYVPVGTGGTLAGLVLGLRLAGLVTRVTGVLVTDILPPSPERLARTARRTLELLRRAAPGVPEVPLGARDFGLVTDQVGPGYGASTEPAREAVEAARARGLALETTYTGKCLAAVRAAARDGLLGEGPVLFWNSYNGVDPAAAAPHRPDAGLLPPAFRRIVGGE